jgi:hypothetical protein
MLKTGEKLIQLFTSIDGNGVMSGVKEEILKQSKGLFCISCAAESD